MANSNGWGDGSVNNNIGWGQGANNTIGWGKSQLTSWSGATDIDGGNAPINTVAPAITGTAQEGQTVTCSTGTWTGTPTITYAYQWKRNGNNIGGATSSSYLLVLADVGQSITCTVTATNFVGSASANSNTITPISAFTGLLDTYSGAAAAYSLRKLRTAYTGSAIRVRRSSDNAEQDFGFVNNILDTASLLTFCGAGDGFVTTWYDQSGNANNANQSTAALQPTIVESGILLTVNSKPNIKFYDVFSHNLRLTSTIATGTSSYNSFVGKRASSAKALIGLAGDISSSVQYLFSLFFDNKYYLQAKTTQYQLSSSTDTTTNQLLLTGLNSAGTISMYKNGGVIASSATSATYTPSINNIGKYTSVSTNNALQEIVFYNSDQSSNRTGIESNINTFYSIY